MKRVAILFLNDHCLEAYDGGLPETRRKAIIAGIKRKLEKDAKLAHPGDGPVATAMRKSYMLSRHVHFRDVTFKENNQ